MGSDEVVA
ncbi:hypothetical protein VCHENC02_0331A, partial [Vibrio harveyi]